MEYRKQHISFLRVLFTALLLNFPLLMLDSCGSDEPEQLVAYYMEINSQVRLSFYEEDEGQGTSANPDEDVLFNTIVKMRTALLNTYPVMTVDGDDAAVISALDKIYRKYKSMYGHLERNTVCTVKLYRAKMSGGVIVGSRSLTVYLFGALPQNTEDPSL